MKKFITTFAILAIFSLSAHAKETTSANNHKTEITEKSKSSKSRKWSQERREKYELKKKELNVELV